MKAKNKKFKLVTIFTLGFSTILLLLSLVNTYTSVAAINILGEKSILLDKENNKKLSENLLFVVTDEKAREISILLNMMEQFIELFATTVQKQLTKDTKQNTNIYPINLTKYKNKDFWVDTAQKQYNIYYWGNTNKVPAKVLNQINSSLDIKNIFKRIYDLFPIFKFLYVLSKEDYMVAYPANDNSFKYAKSRHTFHKFFSFSYFPPIIKDHKKTRSECIIERPYFDLGGITICATVGIYNNGKLIAHAGAQLDFNMIREIMVSSPLYHDNLPLKQQNRNLIEGFSFLLGEKGNIITFPEKYADLFSIPNKYLLFKKYLEKNSIKFTDSGLIDVKKLGQEINNNDSGSKEITLNGRTFIVTYSKVDTVNWTLGYVIEKKYLLSKTIESKKMIETTLHKLIKVHILYILVFIISFFIILYFVFQYFFINPINKIQKEIKKAGTGDFNIDLQENGFAEIAELASTFNFLGDELRTYIDDLQKEVKIKQTYETEILIAEKIQQLSLPDQTHFQTNNNVLIASKLIAAKNVSGDFYDFFYLNKDKIAIVIADVSDSGLQASFFMATTKALIRNHCLIEQDNPGKVLEHVNKLLCMENKAQMFVTVNLLFYNIKDGSFTVANAGHHQGIFLKNNKITKLKPKKNIALGILSDIKIKTSNGMLEVNEVALQYTDGVPESVSSTGEEYGEKRVKELFIKNYNLDLNSILDVISDDVVKFEGENRLDDITLVAIKRLK